MFSKWIYLLTMIDDASLLIHRFLQTWLNIFLPWNLRVLFSRCAIGIELFTSVEVILRVFTTNCYNYPVNNPLTWRPVILTNYLIYYLNRCKNMLDIALNSLSVYSRSFELNGIIICCWRWMTMNYTIPYHSIIMKRQLFIILQLILKSLL